MDWMEAISSGAYYSTFHGHDVNKLDVIHSALRQSHKSIVFLAGDSSLDNKFWFGEHSPALNGYERTLNPPTMKEDVCYWLNYEMSRLGMNDLCAINTAVEATSLNDRACSLLEQDEFIRDHITSDDVLVVSLGGNDIALAPLLFTILNLSALICLTPEPVLEVRM